MKYYGEYLKNIDKVNISIDVANYPVFLEYKEPHVIEVNDGGSSLQLPARIKPFKDQISVLSSKPVRIDAISTDDILSSQRSLFNDIQFKAPICVCGSSLVPEGTRWKPLPSEHWAELMDLWHCHKPHNSQENDANPLYQLAMNGFHPTPNTAYYSDTYYLVEKSCLSDHARGCPVTASIMNSYDQSSSTVKIWKWDLLSKDSRISPLISSILKELVDAHATFTFEINHKLLIWVLNLNSSFTSSQYPSPQIEKIKVLFGNAELLRSSRPDAEPVDLPGHVYDRLVEELTSVNEGLPGGVQSMKSWKLGFL